MKPTTGLASAANGMKNVVRFWNMFKILRHRSRGKVITEKQQRNKKTLHNAVNILISEVECKPKCQLTTDVILTL